MVARLRVRVLFFDAPKVRRAVDRAKRRALSKAGAFIRTRARSGIRKRKGSSPPGKPPHSHAGHLRKLILFGYDRSTDSVVVGPLGFSGSKAPQTLEEGGRTVVERRIAGGKVVKRRVKIAPRPFMGPALDAEESNIPKQFRNSVRRGGGG